MSVLNEGHSDGQTTVDTRFREHLLREAHARVREHHLRVSAGRRCGPALHYHLRVRADHWRGVSVMVTGHTGFKGAWLCLLLNELGAQVHGYAHDPLPGTLYERADVQSLLASDTRGDVRDRDAFQAALSACQAEVVLHLAAQSVVSTSYDDPVETFASNVIGTAVVLDVVRATRGVRSCVIVTTDKVYRNREWRWGYREVDELGGDDPYSASKAAAELVAHSMATSFPSLKRSVATARAGNVIGGGDTTRDALVPEVVSALAEERAIELRSPRSIRPWQYVLEPLSFYLTLAERLPDGGGQGAWNAGPQVDEAMSVGELVDRMTALWGKPAEKRVSEPTFHETVSLMLDSSKARSDLQWRPRLTTIEAIEWTVEWEQAVRSGRGAMEITLKQIDRYLNL